METNATVTGVTTSSSKLVTVTFVDLYNEKKKVIAIINYAGHYFNCLSFVFV